MLQIAVADAGRRRPDARAQSVSAGAINSASERFAQYPVRPTERVSAQALAVRTR
jgi:hypothetical protein